MRGRDSGHQQSSDSADTRVQEPWNWTPRPLRSFPLDPAVFERTWVVRASDVGADGFLRLDTAARYLSDLGFEHLEMFPDGDRHPCWSVRRTVIEVRTPVRLGDRVSLCRWPTALSNRSINARVQIRSDAGGLIEAEQFLLCIDADRGRPAPMTGVHHSHDRYDERHETALETRPAGHGGPARIAAAVRAEEF
ncbi:acyl-ACP thioesterase domain-containing protein [Nocardia sp. AG03]|uniref:acyl-ACP thioesterase domain-containing protein n=1 Tax=Nocardia sp. AG03 TaxID=3025312 RepID=UPI0024189414|nr:acyl-ACP thioesterase domain-containing protein [Nocardia sp. AG03]